MTGIYICMRCKKEFGPDGVADPRYEEKHNDMVYVSKFTETYGISENLIFCPECGKMIWKTIKDMCDGEGKE